MNILNSLHKILFYFLFFGGFRVKIILYFWYLTRPDHRRFPISDSEPDDDLVSAYMRELVIRAGPPPDPTPIEKEFVSLAFEMIMKDHDADDVFFSMFEAAIRASFDYDTRGGLFNFEPDKHAHYFFWRRVFLFVDQYRETIEKAKRTLRTWSDEEREAFMGAKEETGE